MTTAAVELASFPVRTQLRVVPAPASAPPYDDVVPAPVLRLVPTPPTEVAPRPLALDAYDERWLDPDRTPTVELPPARPHVAMVVQALLEVFAGARPLQQLRRQLSMELYAEVYARLEGNRRTRLVRPDPRSVRSAHVQTWPEGIAEACATVRRGERLIAVALRFEGCGGSWVCTEIEGL